MHQYKRSSLDFQFAGHKTSDQTTIAHSGIHNHHNLSNNNNNSSSSSNDNNKVNDIGRNDVVIRVVIVVVPVVIVAGQTRTKIAHPEPKVAQQQNRTARK